MHQISFSNLSCWWQHCETSLCYLFPCKTNSLLSNIGDCIINVQTNSCCSPPPVQHNSVYCWMHKCMRSHYQWTAISLQFVVLQCRPVCFNCFPFFMWLCFCQISLQQEKSDLGVKRDIDGMGVPEIKYGDMVCFIMHVATGLWLSYLAPDAKSSRLGPLKRRVSFLCCSVTHMCPIKQQATVDYDSKAALVDFQCRIMLKIVYQNAKNNSKSHLADLASALLLFSYLIFVKCFLMSGSM